MTLLRALFCLCVAIAACRAADDWEMRWRVFTDAANSISFRYPYDFYAPDQYKPELIRRRERTEIEATGEIREVVIDGKKVKVLVSSEAPRPGPDLRCVSAPVAQFAEVPAGDLTAVGNKLGARSLSWTTYDYYRKSEDRPHGNPTWAPKDIQAMIGDGPKGCGLVIKHGDQYSGVFLAGALKERDNQAILDSVEVLVAASKNAKQPPQTWREAQTKTGKVIDSAGRAIRGEGKKPASWSSGWDIETAHYHITSHVSPARLLQYGTYLELLYKAYAGIYEPDSVPPFKLEIHVFNTQRDFMAAAAAHGFPVGQTVGGFFVPGLLSIFVYEESSKWGGDDFSVEHVMAHECSHQFLHVTCNGSEHVPTWLNEGLAVYFENGVFAGGAFMPRSPHERIERLKQIYSETKSTLIPIDQYLGHYGHIAPDQYGEVYAMTNFWLFGSCQGDDPRSCKHKECGLAHFRDYWKALKRGEDGTKAFETCFMADMIKSKGSREAAISAWEQVYFNYVKRVLK